MIAYDIAACPPFERWPWSCADQAEWERMTNAAPMGSTTCDPWMRGSPLLGGTSTAPPSLLTRVADSSQSATAK
jgi:hypothetical protein